MPGAFDRDAAPARFDLIHLPHREHPIEPLQRDDEFGSARRGSLITRFIDGCFIGRDVPPARAQSGGWASGTTDLHSGVRVCFPSGLDFIAGFLGDFFAGAVALPANALGPTRLPRDVDNFESMTVVTYLSGE